MILGSHKSGANQFWSLIAKLSPSANSSLAVGNLHPAPRTYTCSQLVQYFFMTLRCSEKRKNLKLIFRKVRKLGYLGYLYTKQVSRPKSWELRKGTGILKIYHWSPVIRPCPGRYGPTILISKTCREYGDIWQDHGKTNKAQYYGWCRHCPATL